MTLEAVLHRMPTAELVMKGKGRRAYLGIAGQAVSTVDDIHRRLSQEAPCTPLRVSILRKSKTVEVNIIAGEI